MGRESKSPDLPFWRRWLVEQPHGWDQSGRPGSIAYRDEELAPFGLAARSSSTSVATWRSSAYRLGAENSVSLQIGSFAEGGSGF
jgi:hypothetical protein